MSANAMNWDNPFLTGFGAAKQYSPDVMKGLIFRAQRGDNAAKNHLAQNGFFDAYGNNRYGGQGEVHSGFYDNAINQWATERGLGVNGSSPFKWNQAFASGDPTFQRTWDAAWAQKTVPPPPGNTQGAGQPTTAPPPPAGGGVDKTTLDNLGDFGGASWNGSRWVVNRAVGAGEGVGNTGAKLAVGYNGYQDMDRHSFNGKAGESSWRRVNRWMGDNMRLYGMDAQSAHNAALARLKRDYERAGADWKRSGFDLSNVVAMPTEAPVPGTNYIQPAAGGNGQAGPPPTGGGGGQPAPPAAQQPNPGGVTPDGYRGQNAGNSAGGMNALGRMALAQDPNLAYDHMMRQLGIDPDAPGLFTKFLRQRFSPLLQARMAAEGLQGATSQDGQLQQGNYMDNIDSLIASFGQQAGQKGGNFFGNLAATGNAAARNAAPVLGQLTDQDQAIQYLQQLGSLRFAGQNPLLQQAGADVMERGQRGYARQSLDDLNSGRNTDPFTQWLMNQSQYRGIYGF